MNECRQSSGNRHLFEILLVVVKGTPHWGYFIYPLWVMVDAVFATYHAEPSKNWVVPSGPEPTTRFHSRRWATSAQHD